MFKVAEATCEQLPTLQAMQQIHLYSQYISLQHFLGCQSQPVHASLDDKDCKLEIFKSSGRASALGFGVSGIATESEVSQLPSSIQSPGKAQVEPGQGRILDKEKSSLLSHIKLMGSPHWKGLGR